MFDLLDITHKVLPVTVVGSGLATPVPAYTDGQRFYFDDSTMAVVGKHLTGRLDLAGRLVLVERASQGWQEQRGPAVHPLHERRIAGGVVYRLDDEWLFTPVAPRSAARQRCS